MKKVCVKIYLHISHHTTSVSVVQCLLLRGLQRLPISLNTYCELRISENVNRASKHASFLGQNSYDKII